MMSGLLLVMGFLPIYAETFFKSTAHAGIRSEKLHFVFGDLLHFLFQPVAFLDRIIAGTLALTIAATVLLTWVLRKNLIPLFAFVLFMLNLLFVCSSLPAIFQWNTAYFVYERLPGFYIMFVLLLLFDVLTVYLFVKTEKQKE